MRNLSLLSVLAAFLFVNTAQAGFLIEPYVGTGQFASTVDLASEDEEKATLSTMGARVGYGFLGTLYAGIDYANQTTEVSNEDASMTNMAAFFGVDLPILLRAWAKYYVSSSLDLDITGVGDADFKDGYAVGIGFTGLPFVSLNLELQNINYTVDVSGNDVDLTTAGTVFSVSLPLDL